MLPALPFPLARETKTDRDTVAATRSEMLRFPLAIRVRAPADTINRCNSAGGKTRHAARNRMVAGRYTLPLH